MNNVFQPRGGLASVRHRLERGKPIRVAYFGGSITAGAGATDPERTSWRVRVSHWLRTRFPGADVIEIAAGMGGTGSDLGAFRCESDVLVHKPDFVLIEFAVNDDASRDGTWVIRALEGIVRRLRRDQPGIRIMFVYTITAKLADVFGVSGWSPTMICHELVAAHYAISTVNAGAALAAAVSAGNLRWEDALPDGVHPSDAGHATYAESICAAILADLHRESDQYPLPPPLTIHPLDKASIVPATAFIAPGWHFETSPIPGEAPHLTSRSPNSSLALAFRGSTVGLLWCVASDSGAVEWRIDEGPWQTLSSWDRYASQTARLHYKIIATDITSGMHCLELRVATQPPPGSQGTCIRLTGLLVADS